jgi:hypothetical protein
VKESDVCITESEGVEEVVQGNGHCCKHMLLLCKQNDDPFYQEQ